MIMLVDQNGDLLSAGAGQSSKCKIRAHTPGPKGEKGKPGAKGDPGERGEKASGSCRTSGPPERFSPLRHFHPSPEPRRASASSPRGHHHHARGMLSSPRSLAASTRPWPAMISSFLSMRTGLLKPKARILAAIWLRVSFRSSRHSA